MSSPLVLQPPSHATTPALTRLALQRNDIFYTLPLRIPVRASELNSGTPVIIQISLFHYIHLTI